MKTDLIEHVRLVAHTEILIPLYGFPDLLMYYLLRLVVNVKDMRPPGCFSQLKIAELPRVVTRNQLIIAAGYVGFKFGLAEATLCHHQSHIEL